LLKRILAAHAALAYAWKLVENGERHPG